MSAGTTTVLSTAVCRLDLGDPEAVTLQLLTLPSPLGEALILLHSEEDADAMREVTGRHLASEGWRNLPLERDLLADTLEMHGLSAVAFCR